MVSIAQLVRASDCGSEGRGFDPHCSPQQIYEIEIPQPRGFVEVISMKLFSYALMQ